ncbi:flagellar M-ring protein FliF [Aliikangiella marina]|uniref:Flagellar M-ring protein n=1 Tax=Aliikangiella marina TaxID=1712262 RepID=A0A545TDR4_9GAMM|nr:flagellar basal-body MS-ring/collar protein FliF [Aliikangiella marina]TQV75331.1 flagellar M-ring protein FliF [Aliikangiella marina]
MADTASTNLVELDSPSSPGILPGMTSLAPLKQVGILIAIAASIALGVFIALWSNDPPMRPLENMSPESSMDVINYLEQQQIKYDIDNLGRILVPQSGYQRIQMELGSQGIEVQNNMDDPYLKKDSGFGVSQRMEQARLLRNQEIRLTNTLQQFNGVKAVKVHLAIPRESSFIKNRRKPSASVLLNLFSRGGLSDEQIDAMVDLVSGSIPNLERNRVTITDQFGRLYHSGSMTESSRQTSKELKIVRERQADIKSRIEEILTPLVGATAYTVQVNVDMDFTQKEQTLQTFNPDLPAVRSERTIDDSRTAAAVAGVPGALTNQPPGAANIPATNPPAGGDNQPSNANKRLEAERNFELDTTISHILPQVGVINRISASIGLDHVADPANQGQRIPRSPDEIARITRLVQAAIGFNNQRGDLVSVESFPFTTGETLPTPEPPAFYENEMLMTWFQPLLGLIAFLILIFGVLKPMMQKLSTPAPVAKTPESQMGDDLDLAALTDESGGVDGLGEDQVILSGHDNLELPPPTVGEVKKLEQAKGVVANNPTLVAQLVKSWIEEDG